MAWTTPMTATANTAFTAAQFNLHVRDNLNETAPAKATTAGRWFVASGSNAIVERAIDSNEILTAQSTTSTTYVDLTTPGPAVTVITGTSALVFVTCQGELNIASSQAFAAPEVSGVSSVAASDDNAWIDSSSAAANPDRFTVVKKFTGLTAGSNIFTMKYRVSASTGTFRRRGILVMGL